MALALTKQERIIREKVVTEQKGKTYVPKSAYASNVIARATDVQEYRCVLHEIVRK